MDDSTRVWGIEGEAPIVHTDCGDVQGLARVGGSFAYLGVPFAAPPTGVHRFRAPAPHPAWDGVRPATQYGATAQRKPFGETTTIPEPSIPGESTLNVNIFTPAPGDTVAHLPVFVWIHGGGYFAGSPASPWYDGRAFTRDGIVTVTLSYRLGFDGFGWIGDSDAPVNRGLRDQIAALEWVRRNIEWFGGDPAKVTIGGQSAGAGSVQALLVSPRARGLFRGAISHSGAIGHPRVEDAATIARNFAQRMAVSPTREGWCSLSAGDIVDGERDVMTLDDMFPRLDNPDDVANVVRSARSGESSGAASLLWGPVVDSEIFPEPVIDLIRSGVGREIPLLLGNTRNEFAFPSPPVTDMIESGLLSMGLDEDDLSPWRQEVARIGDQYSFSQFLSSINFRAATVSLAVTRRQSRAGERTWLFDFAGRSSLDGLSMHCVDIPFAWDILDAYGVERVLGPEPSAELASVVHRDWVDFITTNTVSWKPETESKLGGRTYEMNAADDTQHPYSFEARVLGVHSST